MSTRDSGHAADRAVAPKPGTTPDSHTVSGGCWVRLHPLRMRAQGDSWIVGRVETGRFVSMPAAGHRALKLLNDGATVDETRARLREEFRSDIDVSAFVSELVTQGFVAELDGRLVASGPVLTATFPWLRERYVAWLLHPVIALVTAAIVLLAAVALVRDPSLRPGYRDLLWSDIGGAVILGNAAIGWSLMALHELAHLVTARAAGVPGRIGLGTRLQFLVMQTDVSGIWSAPRRTRLTVYLSGIALNLLLFAGAALTLAVADPGGLAAKLIAAVGLWSLLFLPFQFLVFMRTDIYFVLQDLAGCANLYADGTAYARYQVRRLVQSLRRVERRPENPIQSLPAQEVRAVRAYAVLLVMGSAACLAVAMLITLPVGVALLSEAVNTLATGGSTAELFDAAAVVFTGGLGVTLWAWAWWRRHGHVVRRLFGQVHLKLEGR